MLNDHRPGLLINLQDNKSQPWVSKSYTLASPTSLPHHGNSQKIIVVVPKSWLSLRLRENDGGNPQTQLRFPRSQRIDRFRPGLPFAADSRNLRESPNPGPILGRC